MRSTLERVRSWLAALAGEPTYRLAAIAAVLLAFVVISAVVVLLPGERSSAGPRLQQEPLTVKRGLSTGSALFGDTLTAEVDIVSDDARIAPDSVRLETDFRPLTVVDTTVDRDRRGETTLLRTVYVLRCATAACLPPRDGRPIRFPPAIVSYRAGGRARTASVPWRGLIVHSRLSGDPAAAEGIVDAPPPSRPASLARRRSSSSPSACWRSCSAWQVRCSSSRGCGLGSSTPSAGGGRSHPSPRAFSRWRQQPRSTTRRFDGARSTGSPRSWTRRALPSSVERRDGWRGARLCRGPRS